MPRKKPHLRKPPPAPYGAIIPGVIVAMFCLPAPHSFGMWMLYMLVLCGPFLLTGKRAP